MAAGRRWGYLCTVTLVVPLALCCGGGFLISSTESECASNPDCLGPIYPPATAKWLEPLQMASLVLVSACGVTAACLLLCRTTRAPFGCPIPPSNDLGVAGQTPRLDLED